MISRRGFLTQCGQCALGLVLADTASRVGVGKQSAPLVLPENPGADLGLGVERWSRTACDLCGMGEPVFLGVAGGQPVAVKGIPASTIGFGRLCPRARALVAAASAPDRALRPMLRRDPATKGTLEGLEPASWDEALARAAAGIRSARDRLGPDGAACFASDAETCETYALLGRFARIGLGTDALDTPARLDALHAYEACRAVFGTPANPGSVEDVDAAELIVLVGGDVADSHPALFHRVLDARRKGRARVALIDGRFTEAAAVADLHVRVRPGDELLVMNALAASVLDEAGCPPEARPWLAWLRGSASATPPACRAPLGRATATSPRRFAAAAALGEAGIATDFFAKLRAMWRDSGRIVTLVGPGALGAPSGAMLARAVAQLHHAASQWGQAGRGVLFLPRGANATGVIALGAAPGLLPAGSRLDRPEDRVRAAERWGVRADRLPGAPGLPSLEWPAAVQAGRMGAFLLLRANPAAEMPDALAWRESLRRAFVVAAVTHLPHETAAFADVVLPLALVAGETAGTMMTLDRRCQMLERAVDPPGEARPADRVVIDLARVTLDRDSFARVAGAEPWSCYAEWDHWRAHAGGTAFEAGGITSKRLGGELGVPWPCAAENEAGAARLAPGVSAARCVATPVPHGVARPTPERPLLLATGPLREHAGSRVRTGRTPELHYDAPTPQLEMHPEDGTALGLSDGEWVAVESDRGSATARLWLTDRAPKGVVFLPEHFGFASDLQGGSAAQ
jgi:anaerobic selenocysteine-containing dehydrogenase